MYNYVAELTRETVLACPEHLQIAFPSPQSEDLGKIQRKYTGESSLLSVNISEPGDSKAHTWLG